MNDYNASPSRLDDPVDLDELTALIESRGKAFGKDPKKVAHFVERVHATIVATRRQMQLLHRDVQQAQIRSNQVGRPTTLDPATAAQYLPFEEVAKQFDRRMLDRLAVQERIEEELRTNGREAIRRVNAVNFVVSGILEDPAIDDSVKQRISDGLTQLPDIDNEPPAVLSPPAARPLTPPVPPSDQPCDLDALFE